VSPEERVDYLADVPTLAELGYPELTYSVSVFGLATPAGTPDEVVTTLEEGVGACLERPEVIETLGEQYVPDEFIGAEAFQSRIDDIVEVYGPLLEG
jgi:tripartite-type tricarboxylate transporter receptor subunit TctC